MSVVSYASYTSDVLPWDGNFQGGMPMGGMGMPMGGMGMPMGALPFGNAMSTGMPIQYNSMPMATTMPAMQTMPMTMPMGQAMPLSTTMAMPMNNMYQEDFTRSMVTGQDEYFQGGSKVEVRSSPYLSGGYMTGSAKSKGVKVLPSIKDNYGPGIKLQEGRGQFTGRKMYVVRLTPGSTAQQCGMISAGDALMQIDNYRLDQGYDTMTVRQMLGGMRGSRVHLAFQKATGEMYDVVLPRNVRSVKKAADSALNKAVAWMTEVGTTLEGKPNYAGLQERDYIPRGKSAEPYGGYINNTMSAPFDNYGSFGGMPQQGFTQSMAMPMDMGFQQAPMISQQIIQQPMFQQMPMQSMAMPMQSMAMPIVQQPIMQQPQYRVMQQPMMSQQPMMAPAPITMSAPNFSYGGINAMPMQSMTMAQPMYGGGFQGGYGGYGFPSGGISYGYGGSLAGESMMGDGIGYEDM